MQHAAAWFEMWLTKLAEACATAFDEAVPHRKVQLENSRPSSGPAANRHAASGSSGSSGTVPQHASPPHRLFFLPVANAGGKCASRHAQH